jgi:hypothetical protein
MDQLEPVQRLKYRADGVNNLHAEFVDNFIYVLELHRQDCGLKRSSYWAVFAILADFCIDKCHLAVKLC